ncbi:MAG: YjbQ family protein, partial [Bacteroidota bacterium]
MVTQSHSISVSTQGFCDIHDITAEVRNQLKRSKIQEGIATLFVPGSTAGITTIEFESGAVADLRKAVERLVPEEIHYDHDARWGDGNGFAHV